MPYQELPGIGMQGLNTDTPAQALDQAYFSAGNNMRPFDGSLQTAFGFADVSDNITPLTPSDGILRRDVYAFTHFIQTGSDKFRAAYFFKDPEDGEFKIQIINDITGEGAIVEGSVTPNGPTMIATRLGLQLFAFNGVLVVNDGADGGPEFFKAVGDDPPELDSAGWLGSAVSTERIVPYNNRLVALNIDGDYLDASLGNATIVWSTPITELGDISGVNFAFTANNSAGDDILTETPGEVIDAGTLGTYLIVYKDDAVYRYTDTGSPLFLVGEPLFVDDGLYSSDCFVDIGGGRHFVVGNYGVYIHDGGPNKQNISRGKIQDVLYSSIDDDRRDNTFCFHHQNDKEVWVCYDVDATARAAYVYNYEQDSWYTRSLPNGTRGINGIQQDGQLYIYAFGNYGVRRLSDERQGEAGIIREGSSNIELHYLAFGDNSKVKYLSTIYPHSMNTVNIDIITTNNIGSNIDFTNDPPSQNFSGAADGYKLDFRVHGRYYHIKISSVDNPEDMDLGDLNPEMTGMGFNMKLAGDR